jgi:hypothetical protein
LYTLAESIFWKICCGVSLVSDELGEKIGVGLGETLSGVGMVAEGEGLTEGIIGANFVGGTIAGNREGVGGGRILSCSNTVPWNQTKAAVIAKTTPAHVNQIAPPLE